MRKVFDVSGLEKNLNSSFYLGQEALRPCLPVALLACVSLLLLRQATANVNLFHVAKFFIYLSFTVHYSYAKIGRFTPILSVRIVSSYFYLHITHFKNFSTWISRLPFAVNAMLNFSNDLMTGWLAQTVAHWESKLIKLLRQQESLLAAVYRMGLEPCVFTYMFNVEEIVYPREEFFVFPGVKNWRNLNY